MGEGPEGTDRGSGGTDVFGNRTNEMHRNDWKGWV